MMIKRCILEVSSGQTIRWLPQITAQMPTFHSSRRDFSVASPKTGPNQTSVPPEKPPSSGSHVPKLLLGGALLGGAFMAAYQFGYIGEPHVKEDKLYIENKNLKDIKHLEDQGASPSEGELISSINDDISQKNDAESDSSLVKELEGSKEGEIQVQSEPEIISESDAISVIIEDFPSSPNLNMTPVGPDSHSKASSNESRDTEELKNGIASSKAAVGPKEGINSMSIFVEGGTHEASSHHLNSSDGPKDALGNEVEVSHSLTDAYHLTGGDDGIARITNNGVSTNEFASTSEEKEDLAPLREDLKDAYLSKDGRLLIDLIGAIHAAEKKQAELDARIYAEEKRILKEKYDKELKDARARQLMYAEEAALLEEELNKERSKAAAAIRSLQEKAEEKLKMELQHKEEEAELMLKTVEEFAKAEMAAAIAKEKSSQIEKMAEANLHINALCMAFFARSEEARQAHSVHKLALGALALEDALSKGLPIQKEMNALRNSLEGIDKNSVLDLVFLSLPEETLKSGIDTHSQLNQKFDALKGTLRHFSLIPAGGGGILAHAVARMASMLKIKEANQSGDGIESIINHVERLLAEGKIAEAADTLEGGVHGSEAEVVAGEWVRRARNTAIIEQALTLLQSYATSISLT